MVMTSPPGWGSGGHFTRMLGSAPLSGDSFVGCACAPFSDQVRKLTLHVQHPGMRREHVNATLKLNYFTRMPGSAPLSGDRMYRPGLSPEAASTMPSDMPNFILRGARLATITVMRPISSSGA